MRIQRSLLGIIAIAAVAVFFIIIVEEAMARGPGGGRGGGGRGGPRGGHRMGRMHHHRMGPASRGNFHAQPRHRSGMRRPTRAGSSDRRHTRGAPRPTPARPLPPPAAMPPETRPDDRQEMRDQLEERRETRERRREKIRDEHRDEYRYRRYREELGTTYSSDYWDDDYCEAEVVVDGVTYYECEGNWYRRAYSGGEVTYVVVEGPRSD